MKRRNKWAAGIAGAALVVMTAAPAFAHVEVDPSEAPAGTEQTLAFSVGHGCEDGSDTTSVAIQLDSSVTLNEASDQEGWASEVLSDDAGVTTISWEKSDRAPAELEPFEIDVLLPENEDVIVYFPVLQGCDTDESAWIEIPEDGQDPDELDFPAPFVTLTPPDGGATTTTTAETTTTVADTTTTVADTTTTVAETTTTVAETTTTAAETTTTAAETTTTAAGTTTTVVAVAATDDAGDDDGGGFPWLWVVAGLVVAAGAVAGVMYARGGETADDVPTDGAV